MNGAAILSPEMTKMLGENQIKAGSRPGIMRDDDAVQRSNDVNFFPDIPAGWGLATLDDQPDPRPPAGGA